MRSDVEAADTRGGLVVPVPHRSLRALALLALALTLAALAPGAGVAGAKARKVAKPATRVALAGKAIAGRPTTFRISVRPAKGRAIRSATLAFGDGAKARLRRSRSSSTRHTYKKAGTYTVRLTVALRRGRALRATLRLRVGRLPASGVVGGAGAPVPPPATAPAVQLTAPAIHVSRGAETTVSMEPALASVTTLDGPAAGAPAGVSARVQGGRLLVAAAMQAAPGTAELRATGRGCTPSACDVTVAITVPLTVDPLAAPAGVAQDFTYASPDRQAVASALPEGGGVLADELLITLGTPDAPGTRAQADAAAAAVAGVVSGGIDELGVYEVRWYTPQDLSLRRAQLEAQPGVTAVSDSTFGTVGEHAVPPGDWSDDGTPAIWPFTQMRVQDAWDVTKGSDVTVGIVDGGRVWAGHEDLDVVKSLGVEGVGDHATHVAGLACGVANGKGLVGSAWGCPIVTAGLGSLPDDLNAVDKAVLKQATSVADEPNVRVINMSLGYNIRKDSPGHCASAAQRSSLLRQAADDRPMFRQLLAGGKGSGIVWTISAGNACADGVFSAWGANADLANVITVGATNDDGTLARFSNFGDDVEVAAPGGVSGSDTGVWSAYPFCAGGALCSTYTTMSGTSMSAPLVAGVAALVRSAHPGMTAGQAARCITSGAGAGAGTVPTRSSRPSAFDPHSDFTQSTLAIVDAKAAVACESLQFDGSPGTGAPPATLGGYPVTAFGPDLQPAGGSVTGVDGPLGRVGFSPSLTHVGVGSGWATWSHGYTGDVYSNSSSGSVVLTLPPKTRAFRFYAEPNLYNDYFVQATTQDGTNSQSILVQGNSGARYFGFSGQGDTYVRTITVSSTDSSGFAVGEFGIAK